MDTKTSLILAAKGEDTKDLLNHIAWTDVISPELLRLKDEYINLLTAAVLGQQLMQNGIPITKEMLAGRVEGITFIHNLFARILKDGARAVEQCKKININLQLE